MKDAVIVSAVRTAVGKAPKGTLRDTRPDDMGAAVIKESIAMAADRIRTNGARVIVAGGLESMSMIPMGGHIIRPNPYLIDHYPDFYLNMGLATENVARKYEVTREEQDEFALRSHQRAAAALDANKFADETVPLTVSVEELDAKGKKQHREVVFERDEGPRRDSSADALAKLKPAFHVKGTITAGNSSQMSDGAAAAVVMSEERAKELGAKPIARLIAYATAGCPPEEMGIGPVFAIPKALKLAGLTLDQIDMIELNEAFAAQSLAVIKMLELNPDKVNVNGGAIALGHPLGCTGAKLTASILRELERRNGRYGMVTMCVGGGMGAAGIFERL